MKGLLKSTLDELLTTESAEKVYETNDDITVIVEDKKDSKDLIEDIKEESVIDEISNSDREHLLSEIEKSANDEIGVIIVTSDLANKTLEIVDEAEKELKDTATVTTETSLKLISSYNDLIGYLGIVNLKSITTETGMKYKLETYELTKENALDIIKVVKAKVIEVVKIIIEKIKKAAASAIGILDNIEKSAKKLEEEASHNYNDVLIKRYEDMIPLDDIYGRFAVLSDFKVEEITKYINFINKGNNLGDLISGFVKDVKNKKLSEFKKLIMSGGSDVAIVRPYKERLLSSDFDYPELKDLENFRPITLSGNTAMVLGSIKINDNDARKLVIREFTIRPSKKIMGYISNSTFKTNLLLSRADIITISSELNSVGKSQRANINNALALLDTIKSVNTMEIDEATARELPYITSLLTRCVFATSFSGIVINRLILSTMGKYLRLYEKQK